MGESFGGIIHLKNIFYFIKFLNRILEKFFSFFVGGYIIHIYLNYIKLLCKNK